MRGEWLDSPAEDRTFALASACRPELPHATLTASPRRCSLLLGPVRVVQGPQPAGRASAIRQHVLEMPAPVVADALGYHQVTTAKLTAQTGGTWSPYAARDHLRSPSGWAPQRTDDT